ncbi:hypothetical protein NDU88_005314 [Pleurodeles waltl]|uniref:Uncharacterized protein n=1 Tax=Pleurodeles waltl TaxID=8319 RepID=A0AAV7UHT5_PLEWA|nr:hypothetical protein NDU88_005314 [Pleurodeles waltl]
MLKSPGVLFRREKQDERRRDVFKKQDVRRRRDARRKQDARRRRDMSRRRAETLESRADTKPEQNQRVGEQPR